MVETIISNSIFWVTLTIGIYLFADFLNRKWPNPLFTPLAFSIVAIIIFLLVTDIPLETYDNNGGNFFKLFITPATVSLAVKLEKNFEYLKQYAKPIIISILAGVVIHTTMVYIFALLFNFGPDMVGTMIPKSITTAIAVGVADSLGGIISITTAVVIFTGVIGAVLGEKIFKLAKIDDPVAQGIAMGASAHAMGTTEAIKMGEIQGAMSGLSMVVTGITVVILSPLTVPITNLLFG